jgi:hypothetical protein
MLVWAVLPFAVASPVARAVVWSEPVALQPNVNISAGAIDVAAGRTLVAWEGSTGVWAAIAQSNGRFAEQRLSRFHVANVAARMLAVNSRGDAVIAWETRALPRPDKSGLPPGTLFVAYRRAGGRFGSPLRVARGTLGADMAIDSRGDATIVWRQSTIHRRPAGLYVAQRLRSGRLTTARRVVRGRVLGFLLANNGAGEAALVWEQGQLPTPALQSATAPPGGGFSRPVTLVDDRQGAGPFDAGIDAGGRVTVAWEGPYDGAGAGMPYAAVNVTGVEPGTRTAGPSQRLQDPVGGQLGYTGVRVVVDRHGDAAAVWDAFAPGTSIGPRVVVARRVGPAPFGPGRVIGTGDVAGGFDAAIAPTGPLAVAWESNYRIKASLAEGPKATLRRARTVSPPHQGAAAPSIAIAARGQARILWQSLGPDQPRPGGSDKSPLLLSTTR